MKKLFLVLIPLLFLSAPVFSKTINAFIGYTYIVSNISGYNYHEVSNITSNGVSIFASYNINDYVGFDIGGSISVTPNFELKYCPDQITTKIDNICSQNEKAYSFYLGYSFIGDLDKSYFQTSLNCNFDYYKIFNYSGLYIGPLLHWSFVYPIKIFTISFGADISTSFAVNPLEINIDKCQLSMRNNSFKLAPFVNVGVSF